jgi:hypothetical protein
MTLLISCGREDSLNNTLLELGTQRPTSFQKALLVKIKAPRHYKHKWKESWSESLSDELSATSVGMLDTQISSQDLEKLECTGFKTASEFERINFWIVLFASISLRESSFNPKSRYYERKLRNYSEGLLQLSVSDGKYYKKCKHITKVSILDPHSNLRCGVHIMKKQISGSKAHRLPPGRIFPSRSFYWSVLTTSVKRKVQAFFKSHLDQLSFCRP